MGVTSHPMYLYNPKLSLAAKLYKTAASSVHILQALQEWSQLSASVLSELNLRPLITQLTRTTDSSETLIDHQYTSPPGLFSQTGCAMIVFLYSEKYDHIRTSTQRDT